MPESVVLEKETVVVERPKMLKQAKDSLLKDYDVSFAINSEVLINVLKFIEDINTDVLFKFYEDRIFVHQKSPDNIQYAEVEISSSDVLDYKPGINGDPNRKDIKSIIEGVDGKFKPALIDIKGTLDEVETFSTKDSVIIVRIDTYFYKRIEFHCSNNVVIWAQLVDPSGALKAIEKLPETVRRVRNNPDIKKAIAIIEPSTFSTICNIGGKDKKRDLDKRAFIELDRSDGLFITSGDKLKGRLFMLRPTDVNAQLTDYGGGFTGGGMGDVGSGEEGYKGVGGEVGMEEFGEFSDDFGSPTEFAPSKEDLEEKRKKGEKKRTEPKGQVDQLLGIEVDAAQHVYLEKDYIIPFTKLKGLSPIVVEIRTDKPVVLEQKPYNGLRAMLTIAPRIESDEDK